MIKKLAILSLCVLMVLLSACTAPTKTAENEQGPEQVAPVQDIEPTGGKKAKVDRIIVEAESPKTPFKIAFDLPSGWTYSVMQTNDEYHTLSVQVFPEERDGNTEYICIQYSKGFAVCGTGLEQKEIEINGMKGKQGFYDGSNVWDFIMFFDDYEGCAVINNAKAWPKEYEPFVNTVIYSLEFIPIE